MKEWSHGQECKLRSHSITAVPFPGKKSPAVKRLIVFWISIQGEKMDKRERDNWAADSQVDYGLRRLSKGAKKRGKREMKERQKKKIEGTTERRMLCDVGLIWPSLLFCFSLGGDPWPFACASLLQVQALTASLRSHWHAVQARFFHTLCELEGENAGWKHSSFSHFHPPDLSSLRTNYIVWGQTFKLACWCGGSDMLEWALSPFSFPPPPLKDLFAKRRNGCL